MPATTPERELGSAVPDENHNGLLKVSLRDLNFGAI
jgi:hypothetical protein